MLKVNSVLCLKENSYGNVSGVGSGSDVQAINTETGGLIFILIVINSSASAPLVNTREGNCLSEVSALMKHVKEVYL